VSELLGEEVRLTMPAVPQLLRVARLTAAGLAGRLGFNFDEIEDVKIAVDELCFALVGTKGRDGDLTIVYRLLSDALEIEGSGSFGGDAPQPVPSELSAQILASVVDEHELTRDGDQLRFRLRKRRVGS
jgi:anti-sigma regulatory factor (Ser/Thr protein kinase)